MPLWVRSNIGGKTFDPFFWLNFFNPQLWVLSPSGGGGGTPDPLEWVPPGLKKKHVPRAAPGSVHQRQMAAKGEDATLRPLTIISEVLDPRTRHQLAMAGVHDYVMSNEVRGLGPVGSRGPRVVPQLPHF